MALSPEKIAQVCHEANRAYQAVVPSLGIPVATDWHRLPGEDRASIISGVEGILAGKTPEESHQGWIDTKTEQGWVYGPEKNYDAKTHPCLVPYADLDPKDRLKDHLFSAIVKALGEQDEVG